MTAEDLSAVDWAL